MNSINMSNQQSKHQSLTLYLQSQCHCTVLFLSEMSNKVKTDCVSHSDELWAMFKEQFDNIRVIVLSSQMKRCLSVLK